MFKIKIIQQQQQKIKNIQKYLKNKKFNFRQGKTGQKFYFSKEIQSRIHQKDNLEEFFSQNFCPLKPKLPN